MLVSGCWRALFSLLGASSQPGQGWPFFSSSRQYRSTHLTWDNNLTQPLLEGIEGILSNNKAAKDKDNNNIAIFVNKSKL